MLRTIASATLLLSLAPLQASAGAEKIVGGTPSTGHPGVVLVLSDTGSCTGTRIAPDWVLTAAVCAQEAVAVGFGSSITDPGLILLGVEASVLHPLWDSSGIEYNIGLLQFGNADTAPGLPLTLDLGQRGASDVGSRGTVVGFGANSAGSPSGDGIKRAGVMQIADVDALIFTANGPVPNLCFGDTGGPMLATGSGAVIGMSLFSDGGCNTFSGFHRLDVVADFLLATAPVCTLDDPCVEVFANGFED